MKLYEILTEMAWPDKFHQLEQRIRSSKMTMDDLFKVLNDEFGIYLLVNVDVNVDPIMAGSAGIMPEPATSKTRLRDGSKVTRDMIGKHLMFMDVGPGVEPDTPVVEVGGALQVLRHELSHYQQFQAKSSADSMQPGNYIPGDGREGPLAMQNMMYVLQAVERSAQASDTAMFLAALDITPDDFYQIVTDTVSKLEDMDFEDNAAIDDIVTRITAQKLESAIGVHDADAAALIHQTGRGTAFVMVHATIAQRVMLGIISDVVPDKELRRKIRGQSHQFEKSLRKRFPKVKAYFNKNKDADIQDFMKNNRARAQIQQQLEMLKRLADVFDGEDFDD